MRLIASARSKHLSAMLLIGAVALIWPSMALAHSVGGSPVGGSSGGGGPVGGSTGGGHSSGGSSSSSSGHSTSGHSTAPSSTHLTAAVSHGRTDTTSSKNHKRWFFFRHAHVMHTDCLSQPENTASQVHDAGCDVRQSRQP